MNDFRKLCAFEAYTPTDNVSELTARVNDEGWDGSFAAWLEIRAWARATPSWCSPSAAATRRRSVGEPGARARAGGRAGSAVFGVVGRDGGATRAAAEACVLIPTVSPDRITPHTEGLCAVVWHLLVSHPALKRAATKWESTK